MYCPNCGQQNAAEYRFCAGCGADLHQVAGGGNPPAPPAPAAPVEPTPETQIPQGGDISDPTPLPPVPAPMPLPPNTPTQLPPNIPMQLPSNTPTQLPPSGGVAGPTQLPTSGGTPPTQFIPQTPLQPPPQYIPQGPAPYPRIPDSGSKLSLPTIIVIILAVLILLKAMSPSPKPETRPAQTPTMVDTNTPPPPAPSPSSAPAGGGGTPCPLPTVPGATTPVSLQDPTMCDKVDPSGGPIGSVTSYGANDTFYCSVKAYNLKEGSQIAVVWQGPRSYCRNNVLPSKKRGNFNVWFKLAPADQPWPSGEYTIFLVADGVLQRSLSFQVR